MGLDKAEVSKAYIRSKGNIPEALCRYILKNGCNGFRCKKCVCNEVCDRNPEHASRSAYIILRSAYRIIKEKEAEENK